MKRPYVQIRGIQNEMHGTCTLETIYAEPGAKPVVERMDFITLEALHKGMKKCIAYAKHHSYDYDASIIVL